MNACKRLLAIALVFFSLNEMYAQAPRKKEDRAGRLRHEFNMLKNPKSGKIPKNIREQELKFVQSEESHLLPSGKNHLSRQASTQTWDQRGPFNQGGRTRAIGIDSRDENMLLAGGTSGGMYRSTNGGTSWTIVTDPMANPSITGVAQNPLAEDTWYYITGETKGSVDDNQSDQVYVGDGVYKSTDNGLTWTQLVSTDPENSAIEGSGARSDWQLCTEIVIDPIDGSILITNVGGVYRSANAGASWTLVLDAKGLPEFADVTHIDVAAVDASNRVYYASTHSSGTKKGFFRSTDGVNWSQLSDPPGFGGGWERILVSIAQSNTSVAWFLAYGSSLAPANSQLWKYDHSNTSWTDFTDKLPGLGGNSGDFETQQSYNMVMAVKPDDENAVFIGGSSLWRSSDAFTSSIVAANTGNSTWVGGYSPDDDVDSYPGHHPDVHELVFFPNNPDKALCGHDGGVSITTNVMADNGVPAGKSKPHPITWTSLNNGLFTTQAYAISIDPTTSSSADIVAGFQDNGNFRTTENGASIPWNEEPYGGDGSWNAIAPGGDTWYISQQQGTVARNSNSQPAGPYVNPLAAGQGGTNIFISPFILDRVDANIMYYPANTDLWRNNSISTVTGGNDGTSEGWTNLTLSTTLTGNITALETSVSPANTLYIGTSDGEVYKISDANSGSSVTLTDIYTGKGLSTGFVNSIDVDPADGDNVFLTFSNYGVISIFNSTDGGTNWANISGNLEENVDGSGAGPSVRWVHVFKKSDDSNVYYIGASTGLYSTETLDGINTDWTQEGTSSIGNVPVSMIRSRKADGYIAVGTHGKGMFSANFATADVTAPTISSLSPADGATDVAIDANLIITFSENVIDGGGSVIIKKSSDNSIFESMTVASANITISNTTVTINPTSDMELEASYYVEIEASAFKDATDNTFVGITNNTTWDFATIGPDLTAPTAVTLIPADGTSQVPIDMDLTITFNEPISDGGGNLIIKKISDDAIVETIAISSNQVTLSNSTATINPTNDFDNSTSFYIEIEQTAFKDAAGNFYAGIADNITWDFTTLEIDTTPPSITVLSPTNGATDVAIDQNLIITFDEEVMAGSGNIIIKSLGDDTTIESIDVSSNTVVFSSNMVIIDPSIDLISTTSYYVEIDDTAIQDIIGNVYLGISDNSGWSFTTVSITGLEEFSIKDKMIVTPTQFGLYVEFLGMSINRAEIKLYSLDGRLATYTSKVYMKNNTAYIKASLKPGIYLLASTTQRGIFTKKFLIK